MKTSDLRKKQDKRRSAHGICLRFLPKWAEQSSSKNLTRATGWTPLLYGHWIRRHLHQKKANTEKKQKKTSVDTQSLTITEQKITKNGLYITYSLSALLNATVPQKFKAIY